MVKHSFIKLKGGFKIDYSKTTNKEIYLIIENYSKEKRQDLLTFFKRNFIAYKELKDLTFIVYWHDWLELADKLEEYPWLNLDRRNYKGANPRVLMNEKELKEWNNTGLLPKDWLKRVRK